MGYGLNPTGQPHFPVFQLLPVEHKFALGFDGLQGALADPAFFIQYGAGNDEMLILVFRFSHTFSVE